MPQSITNAVLNSLRAMAKTIAAGRCPLCDSTGQITHVRCDNCTNGLVDGATCISCHGQPIHQITATHCPDCTLSQ